jgi:hypothetical protein
MIALYGIILPHDVATSIYKNHYNETWETFSMSPSLLDNMSEEEVDATLSGIAREDSPYNGKGHGDDFVVFNLAMLTHSENFHADIDLIYDKNEKIPHYFGIVVADTGMGDKVSAFTNNIPQEAIDNFKEYAEPILNKYGIINTVPKLEIIQQNC